MLQARLCLEMTQTESSDEQISPSEETAKDDTNEDASQESSDNDSKLAARKKAKGSIEEAHVCMKKLLTEWYHL